MVRFLSKIFYNLILFFNFFLNKNSKNNFIYFLKNKLEKKNYIKIKIDNETVNFYAPNDICRWRYDTIYSKEPETIEWINNFEKNKNLIFWDIGANIGIYSIYTAVKYKNARIVSFEPSTSNLRTLSRNISINKLSDRIKINQMPLYDKEFGFQKMKEEKFVEGGALNSFSVDYGFDGKAFVSKNVYEMFGVSINFLLDNAILEIPNYIKIDVDGIENLILKGGDKFLKNKKIKGILIELNEKFNSQLTNSLNILEKSNFELVKKQHSSEFDSSLKYSSIYNYIFEKKSNF